MRYTAGSYVTDSKEEAEAMGLYGSKTVRPYPAEIVHADHEVAYWSDDVVTKGCFITVGSRKETLPKAGRDMIADALGSDSGKPLCGWKLLSQVEEVVETKQLSSGPSNGVYRAEAFVEHTCKLTTGETIKLYVRSEGYFEGYSFEVSTDRKDFQ